MAGERLHHRGGGRSGEGQAAQRQPAPDRRAHLRGRLLRRGSAAHAAVAVRRGQALQRRPVGPHDARPAPAAGGAPRADRRPRPVRSHQGMARPGHQARRRRRLGQAARCGRASARHSALAPRRRAEDGRRQGDRRSAAGKAAGRLAGRQARSRRDRLRRDEVGEVGARRWRPSRSPTSSPPATSSTWRRRMPSQRRRRLVADADPGGRRRHRRDGSQYGPRARRGRRLLVRHEPVRPRHPGQAPAGLRRSSRSSTRRRSTTATSRLRSFSMRPSRSSRAPARTSGSRRTTRRNIRAVPRRCASASRTRATR